MWPLRDQRHDGPQTEAYIFASADGRQPEIATAACDIAPPRRCVIQAEGIIDDTTAEPVSISDILRYGPGA